MKTKPIKTFTFEYRGGEITYNRLDGYSAFYPAGNRLGGADSKTEAEALIDEARLARAGKLEITEGIINEVEIGQEASHEVDVAPIDRERARREMDELFA